MTSLLRKKLRTIVRNSTKHWLLCIIAGSGMSATWPVAAYAQEQIPVNPFRSPPSGATMGNTPAALRSPNSVGQPPSNAMRTANSSPAEFQPRNAQPLPTEPVDLGSGEVVLRWRSSTKVTPAAAAMPAGHSENKQTVASRNTKSTQASARPASTRNGSTNRMRTNPIVAASYQDPSAPPLATPGAIAPIQDPFRDRGANPALPNLPPPALQNNVENQTVPEAGAVDGSEAAPLPTFPPANIPSAGGAPEIENATPSPEPNRFPGLLPPADMPEDSESAPIPIQPPEQTTLPSGANDSSAAGNESSNLDASASDRGGDPLAVDERSAPAGYTCDEIRARLKGDTIDRIELDVSPRFGRGSKSTEITTELQQKFAAEAPVRTWYDRSGRELAQGRLQDWRRNRVILDVNGEEITIPVTDLSEKDLAYVSDAWGVPHLCGLSDEDWKHRQFSPIKMTWKASELMHKPLYFEDVALERYGHSAGPVWQPVLSSGHFFANIAVLPYKMGIHPMSECQYALGYYRPGNCAPWQIPAVPLSGRGALMQAGVVTGMAGLLP
jgi:hypothetical protein